MGLTSKQSNLLNKQSIAVLATSDGAGRPRAIFVEVNKIEGDKIIITDNEMKVTKENLLKNENAFLLAFEEDYHYCLKIEGKANYYTEGKYFELVNNLEENEDFSPKGAIVVTVEEVSEFN